MVENFDKLSRMLTQEKRLGYKNKAVFGGFEKLAPNWANDALQKATTDDERTLIDDVVKSLQHYPDVDDAERPKYVHQILVKLYKAGENRTVSATKKETQSSKPVQTRSPQPSVTQPPTTKPPSQPLRNKQEEGQKPDTSSTSGDNGSSVQDKPHTQLLQNRPSHQDKSSKPTASSSKQTKPKVKPAPQPQSTQKPPPPPRPRPETKMDFVNTGLDSPITKLPGIKDATAKKLANLNIQTIGDFLRLYPRRYDDYRSLKTINQLQYGEDVTIIGQVWETRKRDSRHKRPIVTSILSDGTATIEATWFNQPWLENKLKPGTQIVVSGRVDQYLGRLTFQSPEWEELDKELIHTGRMVPIYPLTKGITAKWLRNHIKSTVSYWTQRLPDYLPVDSRQRLNMFELDEAVRQIHFPDDWQKLESARRRLAFDELLLIQLGVLRQRQAWQAQQGYPINIQPDSLKILLKTLPFQLTQAQHNTLDGIVNDLQRDVPMSRLLQGDVGSGKTVVALLAMVLTVQDGGQAAILAPTEILSEQHLNSMNKMLIPIGEALGRQFNIKLLTGSTPTAERREILEDLANGQIDIIVGTHAIIQSKVTIKNLRLAVIDEQHRFGVDQRGALREKGFNPHMLVMTATPIPRTLALTLYGDLDLSIIDEMPPGRQPIQTRWVTPRERERAYSFIQAQIEQGRQAFIICPLVEESEKTEAKSAIEEHKRLQTEIFPRLKLGLLHGRMKADQKDKVMKTFRDQQTQILVSTSVVEVGIDVPNAAVMLVEGANRFGLSQLHQFRGRVGRGEYKSYCLLLADKITPEAEQRLQAVERTNDGFELAEQDLKMRGPGEFFGTRQSGLPDLKLVKLSDAKLLELAREEAGRIFEKDAGLEQPQHRLLAKQVTNFWKTEGDLS